MNGRSVALFAVVGIPTLLYFGVPLGERNVYRSRMYAQETAALKALQTLNTAQVQYNSQFGRYARSLTELGPSASNLILPDLAAGERHGHKFTLTGTPQGYSIQGAPTVFGSTGSRPVYTHQSLILLEDYGKQQGSRKVSVAQRRAATVRLISVVAVAVIAIVAVIVSAALAKLNMAAIQTLNTAQVQYNSQFGRYALSLTELRPSASNLISADLAAGKKQGYKFKLTGTPTGYIITALPSALRSAGPRTFYSDQSPVIRENNSKVVASVAAKPRETK